MYLCIANLRHPIVRVLTQTNSKYGLSVYSASWLVRQICGVRSQLREAWPQFSKSVPANTMERATRQIWGSTLVVTVRYGTALSLLPEDGFYSQSIRNTTSDFGTFAARPIPTRHQYGPVYGRQTLCWLESASKFGFRHDYVYGLLLLYYINDKDW